MLGACYHEKKISPSLVWREAFFCLKYNRSLPVFFSTQNLLHSFTENKGERNKSL